MTEKIVDVYIEKIEDTPHGKVAHFICPNCGQAMASLIQGRDWIEGCQACSKIFVVGEEI